MKKIYKLFSYTYIYYVQGTEERANEYALLHVSEDATFNNNRSTLLNERYKNYSHEIDIDSVVDLTIDF